MRRVPTHSPVSSMWFQPGKCYYELKPVVSGNAFFSCRASSDQILVSFSLQDPLQRDYDYRNNNKDYNEALCNFSREITSSLCPFKKYQSQY